MRVVVSSPAQSEFLRAVEFYSDLAPGLGGDLIEAFDSALSQISDFPAAGAPYLHNTRRTLLRRFPFAVIYREQPDLIEVVAFAHRAREPGYWTERP